MKTQVRLLLAAALLALLAGWAGLRSGNAELAASAPATAAEGAR